MITSTLPQSSCILCSGTHLEYEFMIENYPLYRCQDCNFMFLNPPPSEEMLKKLLLTVHSTDDEDSCKSNLEDSLKYETANHYIEYFKKYASNVGKVLLEVGGDDGVFLRAAKEKGFDVTGLVSTRQSADHLNGILGNSHVQEGSIETADLPMASFDICVLRDELHFHPDPVKFLRRIHSLLKPEGLLFLTVPTVESLSAKIMRQNWIKFKPYHLFYFDRQTIQNVLIRAGFSSIHVEPDKKSVSLEYIHKQFKKYRIPLYVHLTSLIRALFPLSVSQKHFNLNLSGMSVICRTAALRERPLLTVIMPVFNERSTFPVVMDRLLKKKNPDIDREIIIVESNSRDGTREEVMKFKDSPGVKIVLEDRPMGKGHAVRAGLKPSSGDFVLIQDGDLEYDLNDYDILLEPLITGRAAFVLGTRHAKGWKIRQFQQFFLADILNLGHWVLAGLMNLLYRQSMTDPFTMFKVFRRDCLFGLEFECDRFNFDVELVCKLLRKGYIPLEIPINYTARSFSEGKKVKLLNDPPTWIKAIFKYRFTQVYFPYVASHKVTEKEKAETC